MCYIAYGGFGENYMTEQTKAQAIKDLYSVIAEEMPYVESLHYFRMFNDVKDFNWSGRVSAWGLFYDPDPLNIDRVIATHERAVPGAPKLGAYAFQEIAGGEGDLTLLEYTGGLD